MLMVNANGSITIIDWGRGSTDFYYTKLKDSVTTMKQSVKNNGGRKKTRRRRRRHTFRGSNK